MEDGVFPPRKPFFFLSSFAYSKHSFTPFVESAALLPLSRLMHCHPLAGQARRIPHPKSHHHHCQPSGVARCRRCHKCQALYIPIPSTPPSFPIFPLSSLIWLNALGGVSFLRLCLRSISAFTAKINRPKAERQKANRRRRHFLVENKKFIYIKKIEKRNYHRQITCTVVGI